MNGSGRILMLATIAGSNRVLGMDITFGADLLICFLDGRLISLDC